MFLRELPDMTDVAGFFHTHMKDPLYPQTLLENDWVFHGWLGISAEILYDKYPKEPPQPFDPERDGYWMRQMNAIQNTMNKQRL